MEQKFREYRENLRQECGRLVDFISIYTKYLEIKENYISEINIAPCFFQLAMSSIFSSVIIWADKLFDVKSQRGFANFLKFIEHNRNLFTVSSLKSRRGYKDDHWMLKGREDITLLDIENDRNQIKNLAILNNVKIRRDKFHAHFDKKYFTEKAKLAQDAPIKLKELKELEDVMASILNKYSVAFDGQSYKLEAVNTNDIEYLLNKVKQNRAVEET